LYTNAFDVAVMDTAFNLPFMNLHYVFSLLGSGIFDQITV